MMNLTARKLMNALLAISVATSPCASLARDPGPQKAAVNEETVVLEEMVPVVTEPELDSAFKTKWRQFLAKPAWVGNLQKKTLGSYFKRERIQDRDVSKAAIEQLGQDFERLFDAYEGNDPDGQFKDFKEKTLRPWVRSLSAEQIFTQIKSELKAKRLADLTVEGALVARMVGHLIRYKDFSKRAMSMVISKFHLVGASKLAALLTLAAVAYRYFPTATVAIGSFTLGTFWFAVKAGTIAPLVGAGTGFVVRPTTEMIQRWEARNTSGWEIKLNKFYDTHFKGSEEALDRMAIADGDIDGIDFAGMSGEDQQTNFDLSKVIFVIVAKTFGRILRSTHHGGRDLMWLGLTDERNNGMTVQVLDSKLHTLNAESQNVLIPFKTDFLRQGLSDKKEKLESAFRKFEMLNEQVWLYPDQNESELAALGGKLKLVIAELRELGLSPDDIATLISLQKDKGMAVGIMVSDLAFGEVRALHNPERNRSLEPTAREYYRAFRRGIATKHYVDQYSGLVQRQMALMGVTRKQNGSVQIIDFNKSYNKCVVDELRSIFNLPSQDESAVQMCMDVLTNNWQVATQFLKDESSGVAQMLLSIKHESGRRIEAARMIMQVSKRGVDVQSASKLAMKKCEQNDKKIGTTTEGITVVTSPVQLVAEPTKND